MRNEELKPYPIAARDLLQHPNGFLTQLYINYLGVIIKQMEEPRFWESTRSDYTQERYEGLTLIVNNPTYLKGHLKLTKLPAGAQEHCQFYMRSILLMFETVVLPHPEFGKKDSFSLYGEDGHGSLAEFITGLKVLAEAMKDRTMKFDKYGNRMNMKEIELPIAGHPKVADLVDLSLQLDAIDQGEEWEWTSDGNTEVDEQEKKRAVKKKGKGKKGQKKNRSKQPKVQKEPKIIEPTQWELENPFKAVQKLGRTFRSGDEHISQNFSQYLQTYDPPSCKGAPPLLPNPTHHPPAGLARRVEEKQKVLKVFELDEKSLKRKKDVRKGLEWVTIFNEKKASKVRTSPPPGLFPRHIKPDQMVYLDENSTDLGLCEEPAKNNDEHVWGDYRKQVPSYEKDRGRVEACLELTNPRRDKEEEPINENDKALKTLISEVLKLHPLANSQVTASRKNTPNEDEKQVYPINYSNVPERPSPIITWSLINLDFPPDLPASDIDVYLLSWNKKIPKKEFKVLGDFLKKTIDTHGGLGFEHLEDIHNLWDGDMLKLFFYLFTVIDPDQYHIYPWLIFFLKVLKTAYEDLVKMEKSGNYVDKQLKSLWPEVYCKFRDAKAKVGLTRYKKEGPVAFLRKDLDISKILDRSDFNFAAKEKNAEWRFKINQDIRAGRRETNPEIYRPLMGEADLTLARVMELIGIFTQNPEVVWLSDHLHKEVDKEYDSDVGYAKKEIVLSKIWSEDIQRNHKLPYKLMLKAIEVLARPSTDPKRLDHIIQEFNQEVEFYRQGCWSAPQMWACDQLRRKVGQPPLGILLIACGEKMKDLYLTHDQTYQAMELLVRLHRFGEGHLKECKGFEKKIPAISGEEFRRCMSLVKQVVDGSSRKMLASLIKRGSSLLSSDQYLKILDSHETMNTVRVLSHCQLTRYDVGLTPANGREEQAVSHFTNFNKVGMVPLGLDLALFKHNLVNPDNCEEDLLIKNYVHLLNEPPFKGDPFTVDKMKKLLTIFEPYAAFQSLLFNVVDACNKGVLKEDTVGTLIERKRLTAKAEALLRAIVKYGVYQRQILGSIANDPEMDYAVKQRLLEEALAKKTN